MIEGGVGGSGNSTNIPLLCGQIIGQITQQLNQLIILVHSLNNPQSELNLQSQLTGIYTQLQDLVSSVDQQAKDAKKVTITPAATPTDKKTKLTEEKIAKHIQDYQRALLQQQEAAKIGTTITPITSGVASTQASATPNPAGTGGVSLFHQPQPQSPTTNGAAAAAAAAAMAAGHYDPKIMQIVAAAAADGTLNGATTINIVENGAQAGSVEEADTSSSGGKTPFKKAIVFHPEKILFTIVS